MEVLKKVRERHDLIKAIPRSGNLIGHISCYEELLKTINEGIVSGDNCIKLAKKTVYCPDPFLQNKRAFVIIILALSFYKLYYIH